MEYTNKINDFSEDALLYMAEQELSCNDPLISDGMIHRYSADEKQNKRDEWYVGHEIISSQGNLHLVVIFGSWSNDSKHVYRSFDQNNSKQLYGTDELKELNEIANTKKYYIDEEIKKAHEIIAQKTNGIWAQYADQAPSEAHLTYIKLKKIKQFPGVKFGNNQQGYPALIIPLYNNSGEIRSLQFISVDNNSEMVYKNFFKGGEKKGNYHTIGNITSDTKALLVCEGYATGATIHEATNYPVVVAFDANNVAPVVEGIKQNFPSIPIIIAADNDAMGIKKANEAASIHGCKVLIPNFPSDRKGKECSDYNDLAAIVGIAEVKKQLDIAYIMSEQRIESLKKKFSHEKDPCESFSLSQLPPILSDYITSIHATTQAHPIMLTASVLTMLSAYVGTKIKIPEGEYFQDLYANLWILCIAKSGQFKTTALNKGARLAYNQQALIFRTIKEQRENASSDDTDIEKTIIETSRKNVVLPTKITAEAFLEYLAQGHQGAIYAGEFGGWLQNLDKSHNNDFKAICTEFFDVPNFYRYKTKTQGDCIIEKPYASICGVSTMQWVIANLKPSDIPSGFFARFLIITPPYQDEIPPALPRKDPDENPYESRFKTHIENILANIETHREYYLSPEAKELFRTLHEKHIYLIPQIYSDKAKEILQPYLKRWSPYLLKLAMLMQLCIDEKTNKICVDAIMAAFHFLNTAMKSTAALFEKELGESEHQRKCRVLFEWLCKRIKTTGKTVKRHTVLTSKQLDGGVKDYDYVLQTLTEQGKVSYTEKPKKNDSEYSVIEKVDED